MEIKIKYSVSQQKHSFIMDLNEINNLSSNNNLTQKQDTNLDERINKMNYKELNIDGTKDELLAFAKKVKELANRKI